MKEQYCIPEVQIVPIVSEQIICASQLPPYPGQLPYWNDEEI